MKEENKENRIGEMTAVEQEVTNLTLTPQHTHTATHTLENTVHSHLIFPEQVCWVFLEIYAQSLQDEFSENLSVLGLKRHSYFVKWFEIFGNCQNY